MSEVVRIRSKKDAKALWESVFPEDVDGFSDFYFSRLYPRDKFFGLYEGKNLVSMAGMGRMNLSYYGKARPAYMIRGVATKKESGGKGCASLILRHMLLEMYREEEPFAILKTFIHPFYERLGFHTCSYYETRELSAEPGRGDYRLYMSKNFLTGKTLGEITRLYNEKAREGNLYRIRTKRDFSLLLEEALDVSKGSLLTVHTGGVLTAYAILDSEDYGSEALYINDAALQTLAGIVRELTGKPFTYKAPSPAGAPDAMIRCVHIRRFLEEAPLAEGKRSIRIKDELLPDNTGVWQVTVQGRKKEIKKLSESAAYDFEVTPGSLGVILMGGGSGEASLVPGRDAGTFEEY